VDGTINVWNLETNVASFTLSGHGDAVAYLIFSSDGTKLVSESIDRNIWLWDVTTGESLNTWNAAGSYGFGGAAFSMNSAILAFGNGNAIQLWDIATQEESAIAASQEVSEVVSLYFSPDNVTILYGSDDLKIRSHDMSTGEEYVISEGAFIISKMDGTSLGFISFDDTIRVWDTLSSQEIAVMPGQGAFSYFEHPPALSPGGDKIALVQWVDSS